MNVAVRLILALMFCAHARAQCPGNWLPGDPIQSLDGPVYTICSFDDGSGTKLYVGGGFTVAGSSLASNIACWDGNEWKPVGNGLNGDVRKLFVYQNSLYATGGFTQSGETVLNRIARLNGNQWMPLGEGLSGRGSDLITFEDCLYVCGSFGAAGGLTVHSIAQWDGSQWAGAGGGLNGIAGHLAVYQGRLMVSGTFQLAGNIPASRIASWDGTSWSPLGAGLSGPPDAIAIFQGALYAAGSMATAGGVAVSAIARWDGSSWSNAGAGLQREWVADLATFEGDLLLSGVSIIDDVVQGSVIAYDGAQWRNLAPQSSLQPGGTMLASDGTSLFAGRITLNGHADVVLEYSDDKWLALGTPSWGGYVKTVVEYNGLLVVGGEFTSAAGVPANSVAMSDGQTWSALGEGFDGTVESLAIYDGSLIAAGNMCCPRSVARWDGAHWTAMGATVLGAVNSLQEHDGVLYAASSTKVFQWNNNDWQQLPTPNITIDYISALGSYHGDLVVGGIFTIGGQLNIRIARWTGTQWLPLAPQTLGEVLQMLVHDGELVLIGNPVRIGSVNGSVLAWNGTTARRLGTLSFATAITEYNGLLVALHTFPKRWNGSTWVALPGTTSYMPDLQSLGVAGGNLIVGGYFSHVGDQVGMNIARWRDHSSDLDGDGVLTGIDFDLFVQAFEAGAPSADSDADGFVTGLDFDFFVSAFEAGC